MPTCRCENCRNTFQAAPGANTRCPYCREDLLVYRCNSCMKVLGLSMRRRVAACPACGTVLSYGARGNLGLGLPRLPRLAPRQTILQQMVAARDDNTMILFRLCQQDEGENTVRTLCAGGRQVNLTRFKPNQGEMVQQVGNNEGVGHRAVDNRLALLQSLGKAGGAALETAVVRTVIEFSPQPAQILTGVCIRVTINRRFVIKGSNSPGEDGIIVQIGTPLSSAVIVSRSGAASTVRAAPNAGGPKKPVNKFLNVGQRK